MTQLKSVVVPCCTKCGSVIPLTTQEQQRAEKIVIEYFRATVAANETVTPRVEQAWRWVREVLEDRNPRTGQFILANEAELRDEVRR